MQSLRNMLALSERERSYAMHSTLSQYNKRNWKKRSPYTLACVRMTPRRLDKRFTGGLLLAVMCEN
jgi:hypothetical protein